MADKATITIPGTNKTVPRTPALLIGLGIVVVLVLFRPKPEEEPIEPDGAEFGELRYVIPQSGIPAAPAPVVAESPALTPGPTPTAPKPINFAEALATQRAKLKKATDERARLYAQAHASGVLGDGWTMRAEKRVKQIEADIKDLLSQQAAALKSAPLPGSTPWIQPMPGIAPNA